MAPTAPGKPRFLACDETSISLEWDAEPHLSYRVQYKEYPQSWQEASSIEVAQGEGKLTAAIPNLQPTCTYNLRLVAVDEAGQASEPGPDVVIDTQAMSCTPRKRDCTVC